MKRIWIGCLALACACLMAARVAAADDKAKAPEVKPAKAQTECPVMSKPINKDLYVDVNGKRIYVCCKGCIGEVKKNPEKYIKALHDAGVTLADAPTADKAAPAKK